MELDPAHCHRVLLARDARYDGRFFTGVKTTGIYCRPVCPARAPKPENCRFFATAAAAQGAGFRPCLRCRPESAPEMGAWRGGSATVSRGLALIEAGALDQGDVEALATRLGMGERQLRRLFRRHLGAGPLAVAQTRRVLLAKQLIHETDLPMTQVALASGFGSLRRFNETFRTLYARPPSELRRRRVVERAEGSPLTLRLAYRAPLDWPTLRAGLGGGGGAWRQALDGGGEIVVEPAQGRDALRVTVASPRLDALPGVIARVRRVFDLGADPVAIGAALAGDPALAPLIARRPGLRLPGAWAAAEPTDTDAFDAGDPALRRAAADLLGAPSNAAGLLARAEAWRPWRAYAALHLAIAHAAGSQETACAA
jgi:AraC family transcriptional regulator of adaptative response / DNA-3-methyladenine glycosylase II